jgi:ABC-type lipoprotein release transport system permease subunit
MALFLFETMLLGFIAGGIGSLLSVGVISYLGHVGIPAPADVIVVLFAGPRLYPTITLGNVGFGMSVITFISLLSTFYPARIAATIAPVVAMSGKE